MIQLLSELFRLSLSNGKENILVSDEISHVETYLKIQKIRYKDTINYTIDKSNLTKDIYIPKLIIQPLIENSIYHGIKPKKINGQVVIKIYNDTNFIYISVYDNGIGIEASKLSTLINNLNNSIESDHYGLYNVNERLKLSFRDNYYISIESKENEFTTILLKIPMSGVK